MLSPDVNIWTQRSVSLQNYLLAISQKRGISRRLEKSKGCSSLEKSDQQVLQNYRQI